MALSVNVSVTLLLRENDRLTERDQDSLFDLISVWESVGSSEELLVVVSEVEMLTDDK